MGFLYLVDPSLPTHTVWWSPSPYRWSFLLCFVPTDATVISCFLCFPCRRSVCVCVWGGEPPIRLWEQEPAWLLFTCFVWTAPHWRNVKTKTRQSAATESVRTSLYQSAAAHCAVNDSLMGEEVDESGFIEQVLQIYFPLISVSVQIFRVVRL